VGPSSILALRCIPSLALVIPPPGRQADKTVGGSEYAHADPARGFIGKRLLRLAPAALAALTMISVVDAANSQSVERPSITLPATIRAKAQSQVPLPIGLAPASSIPRNTFIKIRGLPPSVALSEGHSLGPGAWTVPLRALPGLKIVIPTTMVERTEFVVTLIAVDGAELDEKRSTLVVYDPATPDLQSGIRAPPAINMLGVSPSTPTPPERPARLAPPQVGTPSTIPQDREWPLKLAKEGDRHLAQGNVAAARQVYEMAAEAGLAQAAMALAATYDAAELARLNVRGIEPNPKEAHRWYELARQLGAAEAEQRLRRLGAN
jgi:hypothetical protein